MRRHNLTVGAIALAFALAALPADAQESRPSEGSRPAGGADKSGSATPRGGSDGGGGGRKSVV